MQSGSTRNSQNNKAFLSNKVDTQGSALANSPTKLRGSFQTPSIQSQTLRFMPGPSNDYINMSGINVLAGLYPKRPVNQQIMQKYRQDYDRRRNAHQDAEAFRELQAQEIHEKTNYIGSSPSLNTIVAPQATEKSQSRFSKDQSTTQMLRTLSNFHSLESTRAPPSQTIYYSYLDGQLAEAKPGVDNFSQCEGFFRALNEHSLFAHTKTPKLYPTKVRKKLLPIFQSPDGHRRQVSALTLVNRPKPPTPVQQVIEEAVNQEHDDSSDEDLYQDEKFKDATFRITQSAIDSLPDSKIETLNEQILMQKYQKGLREWKNHRLGPRELYEKLAAGPKIETSKMMQRTNLHSIESVGNTTFAGGSILFQSAVSFADNLSVQSRATKNYHSVMCGSNKDNKSRNVLNKFSNATTRKKLIKENLKDNKKCLELQGISVNEQRPISREELRRTGFPQIKKFYSNLKKVERLTEHKVHEHRSSVAYMAEAKNLPVIPGPMGIVSRKGKNKVLDLTNKSAGNYQAPAIGKAIKCTNATVVKLGNNRLSSKGALEVLNNLSNNIVEIDISGNKLQDYSRAKQKRLKEIEDTSAITNNRAEARKANDSVEKQILEDTNEEDSDAANPSSECMLKLCKYLQQSEKYTISSWILNKCNLGDDGVILIVTSIMKSANVRISKLYLNENHVGNPGALKLSEMLNDPVYKLRELGLRWNKITAIGGNAIARSLENNDYLKFLDLGWNTIGVRPPPNKKTTNIAPGQIGQIWGSALNRNHCLIHLDISFNKIELEDTINIANEIQWNHTLVGVHFMGNMGKLDPQQGKIDSLGFLKTVPVSAINPRDAHLQKGLTDGSARIKFPVKKERFRASSIAEAEWTQGTFRDKDNDHKNVEDPDEEVIIEQNADSQEAKYAKQKNQLQLNPKEEHCWICQAWVECAFEINLVELLQRQGKEIEISENIEEHIYEVFIHFDFDNYQPDRLDDLRSIDMKLKGTFRTHRMIPQGTFHYFYSFQNECFLDDKQPRVPLYDRAREKINYKLSFEGRHQGVNIKDCNLNGLNMVKTIPVAKQLAIEDQKKKHELQNSDSERGDDFDIVDFTLNDYNDRSGSQLLMRRSRPSMMNTSIHEQDSRMALNTINHNTVVGFSKVANHPINTASGDSLFAENLEIPQNRVFKHDASQVNFGSVESVRQDSASNLGQSRLTRGAPPERLEYSILDFETYKLRMKYCEIRPDKNLGPRKARAKTPWTVELGLFKDYLKEEKKDWDIKCFEEDWKTMKLPRFKVSEEEEIKAEMKKVYPNIRTMYRVQAGYSPAGNIFSVSPTQLSLFLSDVIACLDKNEEGSRLKQADIGRVTAAIMSKRSVELPTQFNPPAQLIRCQFLELTIRCAIEKNYSSGKVENELDAVKMFNRDFLTKQIFEHQTIWRRRTSFTQRVDIVLRSHKKHLDHIFHRFGGAHSDPGAKPHMEVDEFENFCVTSGLMNDSFAAREVPLIFNLSMFTQVDEINKGRHLRASALEFYEMVCRVAGEASFPPQSMQSKEINVEEGEEVQENKMSLADRQKQPLHVKLMNCLPTVLKNCCEHKFLSNPKNKVKVDFGPAEQYDD